MRKKQLGKKLSLNKKTIAALDSSDLNSAKGGATHQGTCFLYECRTVRPCDSDISCVICFIKSPSEYKYQCENTYTCDIEICF